MRIIKDNKGMVEYMIAFYVVSILAFLLCYQIRMVSLSRTLNVARDNLDHACLAGLLVNRELLGERGLVTIDNSIGSYNAFLKAWKSNMKANDSVLSYEVVQWSLYNPVNGSVLITRRSNNGNVSNTRYQGKGDCRTPDGTKVEEPTIYARIKVVVPIQKDKIKEVELETTVDVCKCS